MRTIDGDALEELFREVIGGIAKKPEMNGNLEHMVRASAMVIEMIQDAHTIEPERKKGKWIDNETSYADGVRQTCTCSVCGQRSVRPLGRFCRWCGADMREETK